MNALTNFIKENIQRLKQTSPKFFKAWGRINMALLFFGGIPTALNFIQNQFAGIVDFSSILPMDSPGLLVFLKLCAIAGGWGKFMTVLAVQNNTEIIKDNGVLMEKPCDDLPYTSQKTGVKLVEPKQVTN